MTIRVSRKEVADGVAALIDAALPAATVESVVAFVVDPESITSLKVKVVPGPRVPNGDGRLYLEQSATINVHVMRYLPNANDADLTEISDFVDELIEYFDTETFRLTAVEGAQFTGWEMDEAYDLEQWRESNIFFSTVILTYQLPDRT